MKEISIEYAHIYTNNQIFEEQNLSLTILKNIFEEQKINRADISLVIMVDDYSFPDPTFNYDLFIEFLGNNELPPDIIVRESSFITTCDQVINLINDEALKSEIISYIQQKKKYPCSLFIATWYLIRLGHITSPIFNKNLTAKKLINILPESFKSFEDKGFEIISKTLHSDAVSKIENKYFKGRGLVL